VLDELRTGESAATPANAAQIRTSIAKLDAQAVAMLRAADPAHADVLNAAVAEIKRERQALEARLREVESAVGNRGKAEAQAERIAAVVRSFPRMWKQATPEERKLILPGFVSGLVADPEKPRGPIAVAYAARGGFARF
jgi:hypothetical protein